MEPLFGFYVNFATPSYADKFSIRCRTVWLQFTVCTQQCIRIFVVVVLVIVCVCGYGNSGITSSSRIAAKQTVTTRAMRTEDKEN